MRRIQIVSLMGILVLAFAAPAMANDDVMVEGGGWGHGIGMPQFGAKALADSGSSAEEILQYFYTGAQFGEVGDEFTNHAEPLHIGVGLNRTATTFKAINGALLVTFNGEDFTANPGELWKLQGDGVGNCQLHQNGSPVSTPGPCAGEITWPDQPYTRAQFIELSRTYARGKVIFKPLVGQISHHVIVEVPMEDYLLGLGEVPNSWPAEALQAQVIAARTYALYKAWLWSDLETSQLQRYKDRRKACGCHLYGSTVDQAYRGWYPNISGDLTEAGPNGANWRQAVNDTADKAMWHTQHGVLTDGSRRALEAYYFSSTGGATENNKDVWGGSPYQYLRSKTDPGATFWDKEFSYTGFAAGLGLHVVTWVEITERYDSGSPAVIEVQGKINGQHQTKTYTGSQFKAALGLRSHYVISVSGFVPPGADRVVLHDPTTGKWLYRGDNGLISNIYFGNPADYAFFGDWDCDGVDTPGLYRQSDGYVYLRNTNTQGVADVTFFFGNPGDVPIAGDFDGDGCDTVSIYRPSNQTFYVINELGEDGGGLGFADYSFLFGNPGDVPFVGDWNGDGVDTPGLRRVSNGFVYLKNTNMTGVADIDYFYGNPGDRVFAGDWDGDGDDTLGLYRPSNGTVYLRNTNTTGIADITVWVGFNMQATGGDF